MLSNQGDRKWSPDEYTGPSQLCYLHNHTVFSTLDGVATPDQYATQCAKRGYPAMAATEHGNMASVPDMYTSFKKAGVRYIPGCEIYFNDWEPVRQKIGGVGQVRGLRTTDPELYQRIARNRHLTILAKNATGFSNLLKLTTQAYNTGLFGMGVRQYPRIWFEKLCEFKEGLIVLSGCLNGPVCHEMRTVEVKDVDGNIIRERDRQERVTRALEYVRRFKAVFGSNYFMEVQMPGIPGDDEVFRWCVEVADFEKIPLVVTNDIHYLTRQDFQLQKIMMAVEQGTTVDDPNLFHVNSDEQFMKTRGELWATFKNGYAVGVDDRVFEQMCDNSLMIADMCQPLKVDPTPKIPEIKNANDELQRAAITALVSRGLHNDKRKFLIDGREVTYFEQVKIELARFIDKGFASYFLITQDLIQYGKRQGWPFSPRGSAGGSLVCFLLGIHVIDPMLWELSFDRFMSPSRGGYMLNVKMGEPLNG